MTVTPEQVASSATNNVYLGLFYSHIHGDMRPYWLSKGYRFASLEQADEWRARTNEQEAECASHERAMRAIRPGFLVAAVGHYHQDPALTVTTGEQWGDEDGEIQAGTIGALLDPRTSARLTFAPVLSSVGGEKVLRTVAGRKHIDNLVKRLAGWVARQRTPIWSNDESDVAHIIDVLTRNHRAPWAPLWSEARKEKPVVLNILSELVDIGHLVHAKTDVWADNNEDTLELKRRGGRIAAVSMTDYGRVFTVVRRVEGVGAPGMARIDRLWEDQIHVCATGCFHCPSIGTSPSGGPTSPAAETRRLHRWLHAAIASRPTKPLTSEQHNFIDLARNVRRHEQAGAL